MQQQPQPPQRRQPQWQREKLKRKPSQWRYWSIGVFFAIVCMVYTGRLIYLQIAGQDYYTSSVRTAYVTRTAPIQALRGEIYDRNGKILVANRYTYNLQLDSASFPKEEDARNTLLLSLLSVIEAHGCTPREMASLPIQCTVTGDTLTYAFDSSFFSAGGGRLKRYNALIDGLNLKPAEGSDEITAEQAEQAARALLARYGLLAFDGKKDKVGHLTQTAADTAVLLCRRLDMELCDFSAAAPYLLCASIPETLLAHVEESFSRGIRIYTVSSRDYLYPGYASHILGNVGKIPAEEVEYYTSRGYALDAIVGRTGVEYAFDEYLRGVDGVLTIREDVYGNIVDVEVTKEPVAGKNVYLTIDIDLQREAELALGRNVAQIRAEANPEKPLTGEDASAGALVAASVRTGEILAIASYPTYNLATLGEDIARLNADENKPMMNRALNGQYAPGSTFKVGVAVAALSEGVIEKDTIIDAQGKYTFYETYQPECWIWAYGEVHGKIAVTEAIQESCNYFFYEVGRRMTIEVMNEEMRHFGLGCATGIELPEKYGVLAGPEYRNDNGLGQWNPGDTLQAAIGQSDNLVTPLQLSMYIATILNRGVRYRAHLLSRVTEYSGALLEVVRPDILEEHSFSEDILETVKEGMKNVMDNGSAARVFAGYPILVGGKTGTAQLYSTKSDNAVMTAFAPYDDPEIVVTCLIEQGASGTKAGYAIRDVFDYYFDLNN